jgi:ribosomal protein L11 methyltransferase
MIDWQDQWATHAPNFKDGHLHVTLPHKTFTLLPGPGFGDLSHPTTNLVLRLMLPHIKNRHVIDIGSGSGILSIAAHHLGAASITSLDIDPLATAHTLKNARHNNFRPATTLTAYPPNPLILLNMITSEQDTALASLPPLPPCTLITSGILLAEKAPYLQKSATRGFTPLSELTDNQWLSLLLNK